MAEEDAPGETLEEIMKHFPDWHAWEGVSGLMYARRSLSSPPKVIRGDSLGELRDKLAGMQHEREEAEMQAREEAQQRFDRPPPGIPATEPPARLPSRTHSNAAARPVIPRGLRSPRV